MRRGLAIAPASAAQAEDLSMIPRNIDVLLAAPAALALWWLTAAAPLRADIIHLKSGGKIECLDAWVEGDTVYYRLPSGILGFPSRSVERIEGTQADPASFGPSKPALASGAESLPEPGASEEESPLAERAREAMSQRDYQAAVDLLSPLPRRSLGESLILAQAYIRQRAWGNARDVLTSAQIEHADDPLLYYYLGLCQYSLGHDAPSIQALRRSIELGGPPDAARLLSRLERQGAALAQDSAIRRSKFLIKLDAPQDDRVVQEIMVKLDQAYAEYEHAFSHAPRDEIQVTIASRENFQNMTDAPQWSGGINQGRIFLPIGGLVVVDEKVTALVRHELGHSFLRSLAGGNLPAWLNEGICMHLSGDTLAERAPRLLDAKARGQLSSLRQLESTFTRLPSAATARLAYSQALLATEYLVRQYGLVDLVRLLNLLGEGVDFETALRQRYRMSYEELDRQCLTLLSSPAAP